MDQGCGGLGGGHILGIVTLVMMVLVRVAMSASAREARGAVTAERKPLPVEPVVHDDDAVSTLASILPSFNLKESLEEVEAAVEATGLSVPTASSIVEAARALGLALRGVQVESADRLELLSLPCIAHIVPTDGAYPRPLDELEGQPGYFVVVEAVTRSFVTVVDTVVGQRFWVAPSEFARRASGVFLIPA